MNKSTLLASFFLYVVGLISCQSQDLTPSNDPFRGLKSFNLDQIETQEDFKSVFYNKKEIDRSNDSLKHKAYIRAYNDFNREWENSRIAKRSEMNRLESELLLTKSKYMLFQTQKSSLELEIEQIKENLSQKKRLQEGFDVSDKTLEQLKKDILNNYLYHGIFYVEYNIPKERREFTDIHVDDYRDYGEYLIKKNIKQNFINVMVTDSIWSQFQVSRVRELISNVEMLNMSVSFYTSLKMNENQNKEIIIAAAMFKNEGLKFDEREATQAKIESTESFQILKNFSKGVKTGALYRSQMKQDRFDFIFEKVKKSLNKESQRTEVREQLAKWFDSNKTRLDRMDTEEAKKKWTENLENYTEALRRIEREKTKVRSEIVRLEEELTAKKNLLTSTEKSLFQEVESWSRNSRRWENQSKEYYQMVEKQIFYTEIEGTNPIKKVSLIEGAYQAVQASIEEVKDAKVRELIKSVYTDIDGEVEKLEKEIAANVTIGKIAILDFNHHSLLTELTVDLTLGVKLELNIPAALIRKQTAPRPPWETVEYMEEESIVRDLENYLEWKRIKLSPDENEIGNSFVNKDIFPDKWADEGWSIPTIYQLERLQAVLNDKPDKLREFDILVPNPLPFWSSTDAENEDVSRKMKKCYILTEEGLNPTNLEITRSGYFLFVREFNR